MTDQPLTEVPGTADEPLVTPPGTADEPSAEIDYSLPQKIENMDDVRPMKTVYKFFQLAILNAKEELNFNKEFEGWIVAGMATHGARVVILGMKFMPVVEVDVKDALPEVEKTLPGALDDEVDEKDASQSPVRKTKVVDPFRTSG